MSDARKTTPAIAGIILFCLAWAAPAHAQIQFQAALTGAQQVPAAASTTTGAGTVVLNAAETQITVNMSFSGLTSAVNAAHIHGSVQGVQIIGR